MSARKRPAHAVTRLTASQHIAFELQSVAGMLDRALALVIESRAGDLEAFASALLTIQNARVLVAGLALNLGAKGGAQ